MQEFRDLYRTPGGPVEPMWINEDGTVSGITLITASDAQDLKKAFDFGI